MARAKRPVSINGLEFDALIGQDQTLTATVPSYAVEDGRTVSDTIILESESLSMTLFVTNTPVTWVNRFSVNTSRVANVEKRLRELYMKREPVTVITTDETYTNMAIESIGFSKSTETGYSREIPITFKKIDVTTARTTTIPASYGKSGSTGASAGTANSSSGSTGSTGSSGSGSGSKGSNGSKNSGSKSSILYSVGSAVGLI